MQLSMRRRDRGTRPDGGGGNGPVVPDVALVREAIAHEAQLALLGVLEDRVEVLRLADLHLGVAPP